jgi:hypothetical protein
VSGPRHVSIPRVFNRSDRPLREARHSDWSAMLRCGDAYATEDAPSVQPQIKANGGLLLAGAAFSLIGVLIFVWQLIVWRTTMEWHPFSLAALLCDLGLPEPHELLSRAGLLQIKRITHMLDLPASLALIAIGIGFLQVGSEQYAGASETPS